MRRRPGLQLHVRAIAERRAVRVLALAQRDALGLIELKLHRGEPRSFVRSIAERLFLRPAAKSNSAGIVSAITGSGILILLLVRVVC